HERSAADHRRRGADAGVLARVESPHVRRRIVTAPAQKPRALSVSRADVEDFLYLEAALLDDWKLTEWLAMFVPGARYLVPPAGSNDDVDPATTLFYVADDFHRLTERVKRLGKKTAHVEFPHSRCRRMVSN